MIAVGNSSIVSLMYSGDICNVCILTFAELFFDLFSIAMHKCS